MLGPPVCVACRRVMHLNEKRTPSWLCLLCGKPGTDNDGVSHLFEYPRAEWQELESMTVDRERFADVALMLAEGSDDDPLLVEHARKRFIEAFNIDLRFEHDDERSLWVAWVNFHEERKHETVGLWPLPVLRGCVREYVKERWGHQTKDANDPSR